MGIIVFITAILPAFGINGQIVANAETTGPTKDKIAAKFSDNSKGIYTIYFVMTLLQTLLLKLGVSHGMIPWCTPSAPSAQAPVNI